jgi:hypothetical protein
VSDESGDRVIEFRVTRKTVAVEDDRPGIATVQLVHDNPECYPCHLTLVLPEALAGEYVKGAMLQLANLRGP